MNIFELAKNRQEWLDSTIKNGFQQGIVDLLTHQYSQKTHFIYELLQNAEDALATKAEFRLYGDRLCFIHNGTKLFSDDDIDSITSIGNSTKKSDYTQIGKHGIGFKAVFAYTYTPYIHSGDKHFVIHNIVIPHLLNANETPDGMDPSETWFILPFDTEDIPKNLRFRDSLPAAQAYQDMSAALLGMSIRTLLFLRNITEINVRFDDGTSKDYLCERKTYQSHLPARIVDVLDNDSAFERWLILERRVRLQNELQDVERSVEIAYMLDHQNNKIVPALNTYLYVYFPTEKETGFSFLIQGPFITTKARDNIKTDDPANIEMIKEVAILASESLEILRDHNLLDINSFLALPIKKPGNVFFEIIFDYVQNAFRSRRLLPTNDGRFVRCNQAKLARGADLVDLLSVSQLSELYNKDTLRWLHRSITESGPMADFYYYLVGKRKSRYKWDYAVAPLYEDLEITPDIFSNLLNTNFLRKQSVGWLIQLILYAKAREKSFSEGVPLVRLTSGEQVALPTQDDETRSAWLRPQYDIDADLSEFPLVHQEFENNKDVIDFFKSRGLREIDHAAIVDRVILRKYTTGILAFNLETYKNDLRHIYQELTNSKADIKKQLRTKLKETPWIACIDASKNDDRIIWKTGSCDCIFTRTQNHLLWFEGLKDVRAYYIHESLREIFGDEINSMINVRKELLTGYVKGSTNYIIENYHSYHKQGINGFNPKLSLYGAKSAFNQMNLVRATIIWKTLILDPEKTIRGETQTSTNLMILNSAERITEYTELGVLCVNRSWLLNKSGKLYKPDSVSLFDLDDHFEKDSINAANVAAKLGMIQDDFSMALYKVTSGDKDLEQLIINYKEFADIDKWFILDQIGKPSLQRDNLPSFRDWLNRMDRPQNSTPKSENSNRTKISDIDRYIDSLLREMKEKIKQFESAGRYLVKSSNNHTVSKTAARTFLFQEYGGRCQITGETFSKANLGPYDDIDYFFIAYNLFPYSNTPYFNDIGNLLCISADIWVKLKYGSIQFIDRLEVVINEFINKGMSDEIVSVRIMLAGEECKITWSQRHFMHLVACFEAEREIYG